MSKQRSAAPRASLKAASAWPRSFPRRLVWYSATLTPQLSSARNSASAPREVLQKTRQRSSGPSLRARARRRSVVAQMVVAAVSE